MLSTRPDLLSEDILREFRKLQDEVPAFDHGDAMAIVTNEIGGPIETRFEWFGDSPLASGSIGQVYAARLREGGHVVVKVKRPGIEELVAQDLHLLKWMASTAEQWVPELARFKPTQIIEEFENLLKPGDGLHWRGLCHHAVLLRRSPVIRISIFQKSIGT